MRRDLASIRRQEGLPDPSRGVVEDRDVLHDEEALGDGAHALGDGGRSGKVIHPTFGKGVDRHDRAVRTHEGDADEVVSDDVLGDFGDLREDLADVHRLRQRGQQRFQGIATLTTPALLVPDPLVLERRPEQVRERQDDDLVFLGERVGLSGSEPQQPELALAAAQHGPDDRTVAGIDGLPIPSECRVELAPDVEALDDEVVEELRRYVAERDPVSVVPAGLSIVLARVDPQAVALEEQHSHPLERDGGPRGLGDTIEDLPQIDRFAESSRHGRQGRERTRAGR